MSAHSAFSGDKLWEEKHPDVANVLWALAPSHSQQDTTFQTTLSFTRLTAAEALKQLRARGFAEDVLPSASTMAGVLNRNGYRLRPVVKAKPQKKFRKPTPSKEKYTPFGIVNEDTGELHLAFGSSAKTSDFIVDSLYAWWERQSLDARDGFSLLQIKADNGPESNGRRTQFLKRMVEFANHTATPIQLLYYPPYHRLGPWSLVRPRPREGSRVRVRVTGSSRVK